MRCCFIGLFGCLIVEFRKVACVTGGTGMVGRRIVAFLLVRGFRVRVLSRQKHAVGGDVEFFCGSVSDKDMLREFVSGASLVFHCAAELVEESLMWEVNVNGTENLLAACGFAGVEYFCFVSSAGVVGGGQDGWVYEEASCNPRNCYERSKLGAEELVRKGLSGAGVIILRPTNVVDEKRPGAVGLCKEGGFLNALKVFLKGAECAHVVHADDVAKAAVYFMDTAREGVQCYFVSRDDDLLNSFAGLWGLCRNAMGKSGKACVTPIHLPLQVPHLVRSVFRGGSNRGDVRYSSRKLKAQGFSFSCDLSEVVDSIVNE